MNYTIPNPYIMKNQNMERGKAISHSNVKSGNNESFNNNYYKNFNNPTVNFNIYNNYNYENKPTNKGNNSDFYKRGYILGMISGLQYYNNKIKEITSGSPNISSNYNGSPKENRIIIRPNINKNSDNGDSPYTVRTEGNYKYKGFERKNGKIRLIFSAK